MTLSDDDGDGMDLFAVQEFFGDTDAVEAADLPGRGQGLVASRDIAAGEALVCETALASVVLDEWRGLVCHQCFSALPTARDEQFPCGCRQVVFCSEECQATATPAHRGAPHSECAALARLDTDILNDSEASAARLFVKLLCRRANELAGATRGDKVTVQAVLDALVSNEDAVSDERLTELEMVAEAVLDAVRARRRNPPRPAPRTRYAVTPASSAGGRRGADRPRRPPAPSLRRAVQLLWDMVRARAARELPPAAPPSPPCLRLSDTRGAGGTAGGYWASSWGLGSSRASPS